MPRLRDLCEIRTNFPEADFWLVRRGSADAVGKPVKSFSPEAIGVKVKAIDKLDPRYLYYWFEYLCMNKIFAQLAVGTLNLKHITVQMIRDLPVNFREE